MSLDTDNLILNVDVDGFLVSPEDWTEEIAIQLALNENIRLTPAHLEIIQLIRKQESNLSVRELIALMKKELGNEKGNSQYAYTLFPKGPAIQGNKIAGKPNPNPESTIPNPESIVE